MEEVYVIKLKGIPSTSTSQTSSTTTETGDLIRDSVLGLGVLHVVFGVLVFIFGALRTSVEHEPTVTVFGTLFGPAFMATGVSAIVSWRRPYRKRKMKVFFSLALIALIASATFLSLCLLGLVYYHRIPRIFGETAHLTTNAIVAVVGELIVALLSVLTSGSAVWKCFQCGAFKPQQNPSRQKVIVRTNIAGGLSAETSKPMISEEVIRHVSPHCVISLRATDEQREMIKRVQEYVRDLHASDDISFTFTDPSSVQDEQDLGVDMQNWRNEVVAVSEHEQDETNNNQIGSCTKAAA